MRTVMGFLLLIVWAAAGPSTAWAQLTPTPATEPAAAAEGNVSDFTGFDPLKANKDIEVGTFYFKKGNYDAAIERFEEAARLQPGLARPYLKLGETYEKIKNLPMAVKSYKKYLELYPAAADAKSVRKRIAELEKHVAPETGAR